MDGRSFFAAEDGPVSADFARRKPQTALSDVELLLLRSDILLERSQRDLVESERKNFPLLPTQEHLLG